MPDPSLRAEVFGLKAFGVRASGCVSGVWGFGICGQVLGP